MPTLVIIIIIIIIIIVIIISSNNNDNNTYIAPISILLFSSALEIKKYLKKIPRLHKVYTQKVHEPTKKSKTIMSTLKL